MVRRVSSSGGRRDELYMQKNCLARGLAREGRRDWAGLAPLACQLVLG